MKIKLKSIRCKKCKKNKVKVPANYDFYLLCLDCIYGFESPVKEKIVKEIREERRKVKRKRFNNQSLIGLTKFFLNKEKD